MGIEPTPEAWEASVLPLNYTRAAAILAAPSLAVKPIAILISPMNIQLNGQTLPTQRSRSLAELIGELQLQGKRLAVELNGEIVPRSAYDATMLQDGDCVEIVQAIGGG